MNKNNLVKLGGVALVVAIISTGLFYMMFAMRVNSQTPSGTLVVAAKALKPGTQIALTDLKTIPWPAEQIPKGTYRNPGEVVGNTVFDAIGEEEPVLASRLASSKSTGGAGIPAGLRAVSIHVADSTGVFALLRGGQRVDVQVVTGRGKGDATEARTALENVQVLSVNPQPEQSSQGLQTPVVTLLVTPAQADILAAADSGATIRLALRNSLDEATRPTVPVTLGAVMRGAAASNR